MDRVRDRIGVTGMGVCHDCTHAWQCMDADRGIPCREYDGPALWKKKSTGSQRGRNPVPQLSIADRKDKVKEVRMTQEQKFMQWLKRLAAARRLIEDNRTFWGNEEGKTFKCLDFDTQGPTRGVFLSAHGHISDLTSVLKKCGISWDVEENYYDDGSANLTFTAYGQPFFAIADRGDTSWQN